MRSLPLKERYGSVLCSVTHICVIKLWRQMGKGEMGCLHIRRRKTVNRWEERRR